MTDTVARVEIEALKVAVDNLMSAKEEKPSENGIKEQREDVLESTRTRIEDVEDNLNPLNEDIVKLTPSDDLEAVKRIVNQIVEILSRN